MKPFNYTITKHYFGPDYLTYEDNNDLRIIGSRFTPSIKLYFNDNIYDIRYVTADYEMSGMPGMPETKLQITILARGGTVVYEGMPNEECKQIKAMFNLSKLMDIKSHI
tara:strand:+ start:7150 stop:7476 length:327 start_codon:yes stop_codon:yes gene_type:complete